MPSTALQNWLTIIKKSSEFQLQAMPGDASVRRYFRLQHENASYIVMDASLDKPSCVPFVAITHALRAQGLQSPEILASDLQQGFLLLTDFGDRLYLKELNLENMQQLYGNALDALAVMQNCRVVEGWELKPFTSQFMRQELDNFKEWFLFQYREMSLSPQLEKKLNICFDLLAEAPAKQNQVFMHRDYHSANLMVLPNQQVGILDFQDAFIGPVTYDLVSLLRDCYIAWPDELVTKLVLQYREKINLVSVSADEFLRWFDWMGMQRHLKALLTFSRKFCRDHNSNYLQHIPRTLAYVANVSARYPECDVLHKLVEEVRAQCVE